MEEAEARQLLAETTHPRVTEDSITSKIKETGYHHHGTSTICLITMKNGFRVVGHSACASPENYNKDIGEHYAYKDAFRQLWPLEGYLLRESLWQRTAPDQEGVPPQSGAEAGEDANQPID